MGKILSTFFFEVASLPAFFEKVFNYYSSRKKLLTLAKYCPRNCKGNPLSNTPQNFKFRGTTLQDDRRLVFHHETKINFRIRKISVNFLAKSKLNLGDGLRAYKRDGESHVVSLFVLKSRPEQKMLF